MTSDRYIYIYDTIYNMFLFRNTDEILIKKVMEDERFYLKKYSSGEVIYDQTKFQRALGIILKGSAKITTVDSPKAIYLKTINAGSVFGVASLFGSNTEYVTQIIAKGAATACFFSQSLINDIINSNSNAALNYIQFLSDRIRFLNQKISAFTSGSAESRLAQYIAELPETEGIVTLTSGIKQLSDSLDIGRASLYRAFKTLESKKCIQRDGKNITILSRKSLNKIRGKS